jgi:hypothetical protein
MNDDVDRILNDPRFEARVLEIIKPKVARKTKIAADFAPTPTTHQWLAAKGISFVDTNRHLDYFISACQAKGYMYSDWQRAFQNAVTNNWARIEQKATTASALDDYRKGRV